MFSYAAKALSRVSSFQIGRRAGVQVVSKRVNGPILARRIDKFALLPTSSHNLYAASKSQIRIIGKRDYPIHSATIRSYSNEALGPEEMREKAQNEALRYWTELQFSEASSVLQTYLSRAKPASKLHHIHVLEDQQIYLYYASLLFSQGRLQESAENYRILTEAAKSQLMRWQELMENLRSEIEKAPVEEGKPDRREEYLKQLEGAWLELRATTAGHHHDYAKVLEFLGDNLESQRMYEATLELYEPFREKDPVTFGTMQAGISMLYEHIGNYKIALPLHAASLRANTNTERFDHPHVATMLHHIHTLQDTPEERKRLEAVLDKGDSKWREKAYDEPRTHEEVLNEILDSQSSSSSSETPTLNPTSSDPVESQSTQVSPKASDQWSTEQVLEILSAEAKEESVMLKAMLKIQRPTLGNIHMALLPGLLQLATMERRLKNFEESFSLIQEALHIVRTLKGESHADYATVLMHLSIHYHANGMLTEAEVTTRQALSLKEQILPIDHLHIGLIQYDLALILSKRSLHRESFVYFKTSFDVFKRHLFEDHPYTKLTQTALKRAEEVSYRQQIEDTQSKLSPLKPSL